MERVTSGIPGLDTMLNGGFIPDTTILLSGPPGAGKTTSALQFLVEGAKRGEKGLFITMEQTVEDVIRFHEHMPIRKYLEKDLIGMMSFSPLPGDPHQLMAKMKSDLAQKTLEARGAMPRLAEPKLYLNALTRLEEELHTGEYKRLALDSLTFLKLVFRHKLEFEDGLFVLFRLLQGHPLTTLLTFDLPLEVHKDNVSEPLSEIGLAEYIEEYLVDTVIRLYSIQNKSKIQRAVHIVESRGTAHDNVFRPYEITKDGLKINTKKNALA